jgi:peptide/nickel transport system substrate-binding protein
MDPRLHGASEELPGARHSRRGLLNLTAWLASAACALALTAATAAPAAAPAADQPQKGGQIIIGTWNEPTQLNPVVATPAKEQRAMVASAIHDALWRLGPKGAIPNLAVEMPTVANRGISADGLTYTVKLRRDAKWHDGTPFTAKDVVFSYQALINPNVKPADVVGPAEMETMEAVDDFTVRWRMKRRYAPILTALADFYIVPHHILSKSPDLNTDPYNNRPIGTGPFVFSEWVKGSHIILQANKSYHGPGPYLDKLIFKSVPDLTVLFTQLKTGEIDVVGYQGVLIDHYNEAKTLPNVKVFAESNPDMEIFGFSHLLPMFQDRKLRQALYYGINKKPIINDVWLGLPLEADTYISRTHWAYNPKVKDAYKYDPEKAKQLLEEAGWKLGSDGIRVKDGKRLSFNNSAATGNKAREKMQLIVQQQFRQIGVEMKIDNKAPAIMWADFYRKTQFETYWGGQGRTVGPDPDYTIRLHSSQIPVKTGKGYNTMAYSNPEVDRLIDAGVQEVDQDKRKVIYQQLQELLVVELPHLPIYHSTYIDGIKATVQGFQPNPNAMAYGCWNPHEWWLRK